MAVFANAQKLRTNTVDKFSGDTVQVSSLENLFVDYSDNKNGIGFDHRFEFVIQRTGNTYTMYADIILPKKMEFDDNSALIFILDNGENITLKTNVTGKHFKPIGNGFIVENNFTMTAKDIQQFKAHAITDMRLQFIGGHYDKALKGNRQTILQRVCGLF